MNTFLCLLSIALIALPLADSAAYCTYHNYNSGDSLTTVACSDGANGVMTKFKYTNLSPMWPYVTAFSGATWNSPNCGRCVRLTSGGRTVHLTVIDQCGPAPGGFDAHFDIAPPAFRELFGDAGVNAGVQRADWSFVDSSACRGNKGNTGGSPKPAPKPTPKPGPKPAPKPGSAKSNTRCGSNWADANGKCGTPCKTDAPCGGARCYADLSMAPCNRASGDDETTFSDNVEVESDFTVDAAVADTFDTDSDGNFVSDVAMNTEGESVDAAVADTSFETDSDGNFVSDVAMNTEETVDAAVAEEDNFVDNYVDSAMVDAAIADTSFETDSDGSFVANNDEQNFVDAAVAAETVPTVNTQQQTQSEASTGMQGWMVAILVMFSITTILLLAVIVLAVTMLRKH